MRSRRSLRLPIQLGLYLFIVLSVPGVQAHTQQPPVPEAAPPPPAAIVAEVWGCPMCETVRQNEPGSCSICKMDLVVMGDPVKTAVEAPAIAPATRKPLMPGLPNGLFFAAIASVLVLSFALFEWRGRRRRTHPPGPAARWNLFRIPGIKFLAQRRWFQFAVQFPVVLLFLLVISAGLFGNQRPENNIAPVLTWTIWWTWLTLAILFLGKIWCTVCPWMAIADWISRRSLWKRTRQTLALQKKWPRPLRNIWLATGMFVGLTWLELGFGVTDKPRLTAMLGVLMVLVALGTVMFFERKAFCRYACLVGRVSGLYANFSATELRPRDKSVCRSCKTKDCYRGNENGYPCPTHQFLGSMDRNTYCTLCTECLKTCPEDNISWNVRPPGADLFEQRRTRVDEAYLAVILLSMSTFHGLTMTPSWDRFVGWISNVTTGGQIVSFSLGMASMLAVPLILYFGICLLMKVFASDRDNSVKTLFVRFSYSLLPIALFYHLAHNLQHIFYEGMKLVRIASDPFGWGWDLFGTAQMPIHAMLPAEVGWWIQVSLILVGHIYGILLAHRTAFALYDDPRRATLSQIPMLAAMVLFSVQSLWLLAQPMVMRTAM